MLASLSWCSFVFRSSQCNLWVSGLSSIVSALDLQTLFSTVGQVSPSQWCIGNQILYRLPVTLQVISAKVVARANSKHHRFGYVTLATPEQAASCIAKLNDTELKGRRITVEVVSSTISLRPAPLPLHPLPTLPFHLWYLIFLPSPSLKRHSLTRLVTVAISSPKKRCQDNQAAREKARIGLHRPPAVLIQVGVVLGYVDGGSHTSLVVVMWGWSIKFGNLCSNCDWSCRLKVLFQEVDGRGQG